MHAVHGCCNRRWRPRRLDGRGDARTRRRRGGPDRPSHRLSARTALRKTRRRAARSAAQDRPRGCDLACHHARRRGVGSALRLRRRQQSQRPARHHVRHPGQHRARANSARRRDDPRQGLQHCQRSGAAEDRAVERRGNLGAAGGARERPQCRSSSHARHQAPRHQRMPFDHARLRPRAGRPRGVQLPGIDLLAEAIERADGLPFDLSDRRQDARQSDGLPRDDRPVAAAASSRRRKKRCAP